MSQRIFFLDTSYLIALYNPKDDFHDVALRWKAKIKSTDCFYTTEAVLVELGNAWSKQASRKKAFEVITSFNNRPEIEIVELTHTLFLNALSLYGERKDKEWSLTDCVSFIVMKEQNLTFALTTDEHFKQAGFKALLLENYG